MDRFTWMKQFKEEDNNKHFKLYMHASEVVKYYQGLVGIHEGLVKAQLVKSRTTPAIATEVQIIQAKKTT